MTYLKMLKSCRQVWLYQERWGAIEKAVSGISVGLKCETR
jgi:hypothetical protein